MPSRFAGSGQYGGAPLRAAGYKFGGEAAGMVSLGNTFGAIRNESPDYGDIALTAAQSRSAQKLAIMGAEANLAAANISAEAQIEAAKARAAGQRAAGRSAKTGGIISGIGSLAMGAISLFSDEETKHTVDEIGDALEKLRELRPVTFYYKEEYTEHPELMHHGFIAQEYQKVMPDATYIDSYTGKLCIDTNELIALLVRANQQLESRIARLEAKQALAAV